MTKLIKNIITTLPIIGFLVLSPQTNASNNSISSLENKYLSCEIMFQNTNDLTRFKQCSGIVNTLYIDEIKRVRAKQNYKEKDKWHLINTKINDHYAQCVKFATKTNFNNVLQAELESCLHSKNQLLLIESLNIEQAN